MSDKEEKTLKITVTRPFILNGKTAEIGSYHKVDKHFATEMVAANKAVLGENPEIKKTYEAKLKSEKETAAKAVDPKALNAALAEIETLKKALEIKTADLGTSEEMLKKAYAEIETLKKELVEGKAELANVDKANQ